MLSSLSEAPFENHDEGRVKWWKNPHFNYLIIKHGDFRGSSRKFQAKIDGQLQRAALVFLISITPSEATTPPMLCCLCLHKPPDRSVSQYRRFPYSSDKPIILKMFLLFSLIILVKFLKIHLLCIYMYMLVFNYKLEFLAYNFVLEQAASVVALRSFVESSVCCSWTWVGALVGKAEK